MFKTQKNIFAILISLLSVSMAYADNTEETSRFILALGRFHPVLLHIPIGTLVFLFILDIVGRVRKKYPKDSIKLGLGFSSGFAIITCILGYCLSLEGGYSEEPLSFHLYTGIGAAVLITILFVLIRYETAKTKRVFFPVFVLAILSITVAGHYGSVLTHGDKFLTEYIAPSSKRVAITNIDSLKMYDHVMLKIFEDKCIQCHNETKTKGELSLTSVESLLKGGVTGQVLNLGNAHKSSLYERMLLPLSDEEHMPPEGKPQMTKDELWLIEYWLNNGLNINDKVAAIPKNDTLVKLLKNYLIFDKKKIKEASQKDIANVEDYGFLIRKLVPNQPELWVKFNVGEISKKAIKALSNLEEQITELDLSNTALTDDMLSGLDALPNLKKLKLTNTKITDNSIAYLKDLKALKIINFVKTKITDKGLKQLLTTIDLENVYVWETPISNTETTNLQQKFKVEINNGIIEGFTGDAQLKPPFLKTKKTLFLDTISVALESHFVNTKVYYTLNGKVPDTTASLYTKPFVINDASQVKAKVFKKGWEPSDILKVDFLKTRHKVKKYTLTNRPDIKYDGPEKLFDLTFGTENFADKKWTGFLGKDVNTTIDFGEEKGINNITVSCLGKAQDWILFPTHITVYSSSNNKDFKKAGRLKLNENNINTSAVIKRYNVVFPEVKKRYLKIIVHNPKVLPKWHEGAGNASWIFVDEIFF
ncbi:FN3 associated domain-containing protein [uncultured Algibacter sp.]|uniref:FN3 associated domain-containing protein n=1 Tax=uncultured Algibacter sp. TaxID=298659 RepID=UPI00262E8511|nr:FN3 associated domain-containing protein [uncultured Algibacter sp.]